MNLQSCGRGMCRLGSSKSTDLIFVSKSHCHMYFERSLCNVVSRMTFLIFGKKTFTFIQSFGRWTLIVVAASEFTRSMHFHFENDFSWKGGVASAAPQWICLVDRGAAQVLVQSINSRFGDGPEVSDLKKRTVPAGYQELRDAKYTCIRYDMYL